MIMQPHLGGGKFLFILVKFLEIVEDVSISSTSDAFSSYPDIQFGMK